VTCRLAAWGLTLVVVFGSAAWADEADDDAPVDALLPYHKEKQARVTAGLAAVAGIAIVGVGLGAGVMLWGARLRRLNRQPLAPTGRQDAFWFLRPPKPQPHDSRAVEDTDAG